MAPRVLFLGENWYGSCARACCYALRRLGCDVRDIDEQTIFPKLRRLSSRVVLRFFRRGLIREYNKLVLDVASTFNPDFLLVFKGTFVEADTLRKLREMNILLYNYYPDPSAYAYGNIIPRALPEYDCIFYTKEFFDHDIHSEMNIHKSVFIPHGYDPDIHRIPELDSRDIDQFSHDVVVIATYNQYKEEILSSLVGIMPDIDLHIYGNQWNEKCTTPTLNKHIESFALEGTSYAKAIAAARINLGIMNGIMHGATQRDVTTTRTYEIPACGGFMIHERTDEVLDLFEEDKEIVCFSSVEELAEKIDYYLKHPDERKAIASAGYNRCVPDYSYDSRIAEILRWNNRNSKSD